MWDIKLKATNGQTRKTKRPQETQRHRQQYGSYQEEKRVVRSKGG